MRLGKLIKIGKQGFALPVLSLLNSIFVYVLIQLLNFEMPGYATDVALFGIILSLMTIGGYFKNFTNGVDYPKRALIYGVCALGGLIFFWNAVGGINQGGIGQDAITSSIITIILSFGGAVVSYCYFRR